ncbi:MAG: hypothetical protein ACRCXZ_10015 [Patescibacteria group bacterium]
MNKEARFFILFLIVISLIAFVSINYEKIKETNWETFFNVKTYEKDPSKDKGYDVFELLK